MCSARLFEPNSCVLARPRKHACNRAKLPARLHAWHQLVRDFRGAVLSVCDKDARDYKERDGLI